MHFFLNPILDLHFTIQTKCCFSLTAKTERKNEDGIEKPLDLQLVRFL